MAKAKYEITAEDKTSAALKSAKKGLGDIKSAALSLQGVFAGVTGALIFQKFITESINAQNEAAQLAAVLKSTGEAAGFTQAQLNAMGADFAKNSIFSEGDITKAQTRLLSYTGVVGEQVPQAMQAVIDMASRLGMDLSQSAETIGKALDVPSQGMSALSKQGFRFTEDQKKLVAQLERTGRTAEAQAIILDAMKSAYGGAGLAARDAFGGALAALQNQLDDLMTGSDGSLDGATASINELTGVLGSSETKEAFATITAAMAELIGWTAKGIVQFSDLGKEIGNALGAHLHGPIPGIDKVNAEISLLEQRIESLTNEKAFYKKIPFEPIDTSDIDRNILEARAKLNNFLDERARLISEANSAPPPAAEVPVAPKPATNAAPAALPLPSTDATRALLERNTSLLKDALARQLKDLDQSYQDGLISTAQYFTDRARIQSEALGAEVQRIKGALAEARNEEAKAATAFREAGNSSEATSATNALTKARERQIQLTGQLAVAERDRAAAAATATREQDAAKLELEQQLDQVRIRLLDMQGKTADARKLSLEREFRDLVKRLEADGDLEGQALVKRLFNVEVARAQLDQLQQQASQAMERMATEEQSIGVQRQAGILTEAQARQELVTLHQRTADEVRNLIPQMQELAAATGDPMAIERVKQLEVRLQQMALVIDDVAVRINGSLEDGFATLLTDVATQAKSAGDAFRDFARGVVADIAKIASQKLASELFSSFGGGAGGGIGGFISGLLKHSGGTVAGGGQFKSIPAFAFAGAPRYHSGGIAGLAPDEVPAILRKNEEVLTADDPRHRNNGGLNGGGGSGDPKSMRFVLVDDRANLADYMRSADGEEVFIENLTRNAMRVRSIIGGG